MSEAVVPFRIAVPDAQLDDLRRRLAATRFPDAETVPGWTQGVPLDRMRMLRDHWLERYEWRACEAALNAAGQYRTQIDGLGIHFLHIRSPEPDAMPLLLTHGWPGSVLEFMKVAGPLGDPRAHGADPADAFHLVIPALPGYGFSDRPREAGWTVERIADAWSVLMTRLGYDRFGAQGGDWGAAVTHALAVRHPERLTGVHFNMVVAQPDDAARADPTPDEAARIAGMRHHNAVGRGYAEVQRTRPQTIGYALADSPVGQLAWIHEKFREWSDCDGDPLNSYSIDEMIDAAMLYWLPNSGASSAQLYWNSLSKFIVGDVTVPVGGSVFPREIFRPTRAWAEARYPTLAYWNEPARGGHFAALEVPDLFVDEVRACFRLFRSPASA